jgi:hypothetical protein
MSNFLLYLLLLELSLTTSGGVSRVHLLDALASLLKPKVSTKPGLAAV